MSRMTWEVSLPERRRHVTAVDVSKIGEIAFAG